MANKYSGIIFDYGGTLDTRGDHWSEVIWDGYRHESVPVGKQAFRDAYVYAERVLAVNPVVKADFHFADILRAKIRLQLASFPEGNFFTRVKMMRRSRSNLALCWSLPMSK